MIWYIPFLLHKKILNTNILKEKNLFQSKDIAVFYFCEKKTGPISAFILHKNYLTKIFWKRNWKSFDIKWCFWVLLSEKNWSSSSDISFYVTQQLSNKDIVE